MALVVQHNLSAMNANNKMNVNVTGYKKATEKLSSGYQINRAGDNAAGLAISEKMRSQIRGLSQATKNANDGISLIKTAEGGLNETHSILQRMRELATQSANGTYTESDRKAIQLEVDALKSEVDRISTSTEFNTQQLLDGSLSGGGKVTEYGALFGTISSKDAADADLAIGGGQITVTSSMQGVSLNFTIGASGKGGENAVWNTDGNELTINLVEDRSYTDAEIQKLIDNATVDKANDANVPTVTFKSEYGVVQGAEAQTKATAAGVRQVLSADLKTLVANGDNGGIGSSDTIKLTANTYGEQEQYKDSIIKDLTIVTDVAAGKESADADGDGNIVLHLSTGVSYSEKDIESLLKEAGYDYTVELTDSTSPDGAKDGSVYFNQKSIDVSEDVANDTGVQTAQTGVDTAKAAVDTAKAALAAGTGTQAGVDTAEAALKTAQEALATAKKTAGEAAATAAGAVAGITTTEDVAGVGVGKDSIGSVGKGLTFQIGANGVEDQRVTLNVDDMGADALGIANIDVSDRDKANEAIDVIDAAIEKVSMQRAGLGALQNRLEYTVNNLTTTNENLTDAESTIRDTDMATEMINYTKFNILQQASQAMLAQANQQPQAVLQLLG